VILPPTLAEVDQIADRIAIIDRGRAVLSGALDDLRARFRRIQLVFDRDPPDVVLRSPVVGRVLMAVLLLAPVRLAAAPPDADPSGHWEGTIQAPNRSVAFEVDLGKNARGELIGTFGSPAQGEKGLPLATVAVAGREVRFAFHATSGGGAFHATLRNDGRAMAGDFTPAHGGQAVPFQLTRTGDARFTRRRRARRSASGSKAGGPARSPSTAST
jgi:hypothetical protein